MLHDANEIPIVTRLLHLAGDANRDVRIQVFAPKFDEDRGLHICHYRIEGIARRAIDDFAVGEDGFQALHASIQSIAVRMATASAREKIQWPDGSLFGNLELCAGVSPAIQRDPMTSVLVHFESSEERESRTSRFARVPLIGENVCIDGCSYRVTGVEHHPEHDDSEPDDCVFTVQITLTSLG